MKNLKEKIKDYWTKSKISSLALITALTLVFFSDMAYSQEVRSRTPPEGVQNASYDNDSPKLRVLVPGINTRGQQMLENTKRELRYDPACTVIVEELEAWTLEKNYIREDIVRATQRAIEKNKDVIVLVDMDLEHSVMSSHLTPKSAANLPVIGTRWFEATDWAGSMINNISEVYDSIFQEKRIMPGEKECEAHSAGVDAFEHSLVLSDRRMFDQVNLFNGRTTTSELVPQIKADKYTASQVNLFLTKGELFANPHSVSNLKAVIPNAGKQFTLYYCNERPSINPVYNHSALINESNVTRSFQIYNGEKPYNINASVDDIKARYFQQQPIDLGIIRIPPPTVRHDPDDGTGLQDPGGVIFDKHNTYVVDEKGNLEKIKECMLKARKEKGEIGWISEYKGQEYHLVALPFSNKQNSRKSGLYHNQQNEALVSCKNDDVIAIRYIQKNDFLQIIQVARGKLIGEKDNHPIFKISQVLMTDYPLKSIAETNSMDITSSMKKFHKQEKSTKE